MSTIPLLEINLASSLCRQKHLYSSTCVEYVSGSMSCREEGCFIYRIYHTYFSPYWFIVEFTFCFVLRFKFMQHIAGHVGLSDRTLFLLFIRSASSRHSKRARYKPQLIYIHIGKKTLHPHLPLQSYNHLQQRPRVLQKPGLHLTNLKRSAGKFEHVTEGGLQTTCSRRVRDGIKLLQQDYLPSWATFSLLHKALLNDGDD